MDETKRIQIPDTDPRLQARIAERMKLTKPQLKQLAQETYRPGYPRDDVFATVWSYTRPTATKWELAYHIARVEIAGY